MWCANFGARGDGGSVTISSSVDSNSTFAAPEATSSHGRNIFLGNLAWLLGALKGTR